MDTNQYYEMIDGGGSNVYHLLFYMISNFLIADVNKPIRYYYPLKENKLENEMLALLPGNFVREYEKTPGIIYTSFMRAIPIFEDMALPQSYNLIRYLFREWCRPLPATIGGKKIYISRNPHKLPEKRRTFQNEKDVIECMKILGFEILEMEMYSVKEQIGRISEASVIVSAHGAALAFSVFCHPGTTIVEIFKETTKPKRHYMHIAKCLALQFTRFNQVDIIDEHENMIVNVHALYSSLVHLLPP